MRALELHAEDGKPESLKLVEKLVPTPGPGEVLVKVAAAPINPADLAFLKGMYGIRKKLPVVPGFEGSGTVVAAGSGMAARFFQGRRVAFAGGDGDGTWAEYAVTSAMTCVPLPKNVTLEQGAMMMANPLSALAMMEITRKGGHKAIIHTAAASALGKMLLKLGLRSGLPILHVVRRAEQVTELKSLGAQHVLNSSDADFDKALKALSRDLKATLAFDAVAGPLSSRILSAMPRLSEIIIYGGLSEAAATFDPGLFIFQGKRVSGFWLPVWMAKGGLPHTGLLMLQVRRLISGELGSEIRARLPLSAATQGLADYAANMSAGKVLFIPADV